MNESGTDRRSSMKFIVSAGKQEDLETLADHRRKMWLDIHPERKEQIEQSYEPTKKWIGEQMQSGRYIAFIARTETGEIAGSGALWLREDQPRPGNLLLITPYLLSMYTIPKFRKNGVASLITEKAVKWCKDNGYTRVELHASDEGRRVYEKFGFVSSNEMRLRMS